jgi:hypothetical protein
MKTYSFKITLLLMFCFATGLTVLCQVPQGFNYQAIAREGSGNPLAGQILQVELSIQADTTASPVVLWCELHNPVITNASGLFTVVLGTGVRQSGSATTFSDINWTGTPLFIKTRIYYSGSWKTMGSAKLWTVPYSMVSQSVSGLKKLSVTGATTDMEEALFEVKNNLNQTVFAVYNEGVRVSVGDGNPNSKGTKGGFAIGGFGSKTDGQEYLRVTPDSTRMYIKDAAKGTKGGFAIGGFGSKASTGNFLDITRNNYFIGHETGTKIATGGLYNSAIGYQAAWNLSTGQYNTVLGYKADSSLTSGNNNIIIGASAGFKLTTGSHNTLIGTNAGFNHTDALYNVMIGTSAGFNLLSTYYGQNWYNTFIGINAGYKIKTGTNNVFLGTNAGAMLENGDGNTIVGIDAGRSGAWDWNVWHAGNTTSHNTLIGNDAGYSLDVGDGNVFIGYQAGYFEVGTVSTPSSNKLYIANSATNPPLIYGDFSTGNVGIGTMTTTNKLNVGGNASVSGTLTAGTFSGNITGNVTGNVTGSSGSAGNVGGVTMGVINLNGIGTLLTACGGKFVLTSNGSAITVTNNSGSYCSIWWQGHQGSVVSGSVVINNPGGSTQVLPAFTANGQGMEIHFGLENGDAYCSVWISWSNSKIFGHYIMY